MGTDMKGKLAVCSRGYLGLITETGQREVTYKKCFACETARGCDSTGPCTCEKGLAFVGVHLTGENIGKPWSSRNPRIVGEIRGTQPVTILQLESSEEIQFYI